MRKTSTGRKLTCINNDYFSEANLAEHPERFVIVGFLAADGCIHQTVGQPQIGIVLSGKDEIVLTMINKEIALGGRNIWHSTSSCNGKRHPTVRITFPSFQLCHDLSKYGIVANKTWSLQFPCLPEPAMAYFIRGYFYGDGSIYGKGGLSRYQFTGRMIFMSAMRDYLIRTGIIKRAGLYSIKNPAFASLEIYGRQANLMAGYMLADNKMVLLPRKHIRIDIPNRTTHWSEKEVIELLKCQTNKQIKELCSRIGRTYPSGKIKREKLTGSPLGIWQVRGSSRL